MIKKSKVKSVKSLGKSTDYVYDIGVNDNNPYFFANNILVHNSCYFTVDGLTHTDHFKSQFPNFTITKDNVIKIYDEISDYVNNSFAEFMNTSFNAGLENGAIIKAGRELVGSSALFIKKKKYAVMVYDKEGKRLDINGKPGKPKIMGLDMKRSDTPKYMQTFMEDMLIKLLVSEDTNKAKNEIFDNIKSFRSEFKLRKSIDMGSPKRANGITVYNDKLKDMKRSVEKSAKVFEQFEKTLGKVNMPGHVRAAINWNMLRDIHNDKTAPIIVDGQKCIVCKLKKNKYGIDSIAYPVDLTIIPKWLEDLPYDRKEMENVIIDKKLENLFSILGWDTALANHDLDLDDDFFTLE